MSNGKRIFALAFRRWLVEQARKPGASVAGLALRHGINANQLRRWMTLEADGDRADVIATQPPPAAVGLIELEVFGARLKLHGDVDAHSLGVVLDALVRRG